jgi:hypothetical protein
MINLKDMKVITTIDPSRINGEDTKVGEQRKLTVKNVWNRPKMVSLQIAEGLEIEVSAVRLSKAIQNATENDI